MPQLRELDGRLIAHRRIWERKPALRLVYADYHRKLLEACPPGRVLEIGGGSGHFKSAKPDVVSIDVLPFPGIDVQCDAHDLAFASDCFDAIVMIDVLHHLAQPLRFLSEAARVLRPGGVLAMIEPGMSTVSSWAYHGLHHEPATLADDPFVSVGARSHRDPLEGNSAIPAALFASSNSRARIEAAVPGLTFLDVDWISFAAYPMTGGFRSWSMLPQAAVGVILRLESLIPLGVRRHLAFRLFVTMKRGPRA